MSYWAKEMARGLWPLWVGQLAAGLWLLWLMFR